MERDDKYMLAAYEPFHKETLYCLRWYLPFLVLFIVFLLYNPAKNKVIWWLIFFFTVLFFVDFCTRCLITILSWVEKSGRSFETKTLVLEKIVEQGTSGESDRKYSSIIYRLYPKEAHYGRYKILCRTEDGKRIWLRCAVNGKNYQTIVDQIWNNAGWRRTVTYGRYSHVILWYNDKDDVSFILNRRLDHEPQTKAKKDPRRSK